jgi:hypothetical protein
MIETDRVLTLGAAAEAAETPSESGLVQIIARCPKCRVAVWSHYYAGAGPLLSFVRVGTLDNPDALPPDIHIFTASKQPWIVIPAGVPAEHGRHWSAGIRSIEPVPLIARSYGRTLSYVPASAL